MPLYVFVLFFICFKYYLSVSFKKASEYGQEISHSHTAYQPTAPRGRATQHYQAKCIRKTIKVKQPALSLSHQGGATLEGHNVLDNKKNQEQEPLPQIMGAVIKNKATILFYPFLSVVL